MKQKRALITGITGQDGSYLAEFLLKKRYKVYGLVRPASTDPLMRIERLSLDRMIKIIYGDMRDNNSIIRALEESRPDEIYNLGAQSQVGVSFQCPEETMEVNYNGFGRLVSEATHLNPQVRIYQASSSEMFGNVLETPQKETTPFNPVSPYAESKVKAHNDYVVEYRKRHNFFICAGILFNHESPRRGRNFVTRKITHSMVKIKLGLQDSFELGNLDAKRDWGYAKDYVEAMWLMLQQKTPQDFVISTGESHSVRDFVNATANALDMKITWHGKGLKEVAKDSSGKIILRINPKYYRPNEVNSVLGDSSRAKKVLKWEPKVTFDELVEIITKADLESLGGVIGIHKDYA
ncbi:MAG: GDP-mannose 4,6-dehydratase [Candidatus Yonathbacteria bacterium]|nr:GDP-mannose 4,6-dehydratase [Candidatus Yonathbacteria bacterium]